jgi:aryl-alcohol dehydrogenase-like predicted oxidoreductase
MTAGQNVRSVVGMTNTTTTMPVRTLGTQGLQASAIGLGTMGMTMGYGPADEAGGVASIRRAFDLGVTMFDTAEMYGLGKGSSEQLVGRAVRGFRDQVVIATKFGFDLSDMNRFGRAFDSRPQRIREVVEASLRHLDTDYLDVLYQHREDPNVPIEDVAGTVGELITEGKVRFLGLSEAGPDTIRRAHAVHPVSVLQTEYSLFERTVEAEILPLVRELGIGFVAYSPLGRGFLTGAATPAAEYPPNDLRARDARWQPGNYETNQRLVRDLATIAGWKGCTIAQVALGWLLAQGSDIIAIPGTRDPNRVAENTAAAKLTFTPDGLDLIGSLAPNGAAGARYSDQTMPTWQRP